MKVLLAGASGFIGRGLQQKLLSSGHQANRLVRSAPSGTNEIQWNPALTLDPSVLAGIDAVVGLSGAGIGDKRWTEAYKRTLVESRVQPTHALATAIAALPASDRPSVFLSASAIGFYGERGDEILTESAGPGTGFLSELVQKWEGAALPAVEAGVRVVYLRTGLVLASSGGLLKRLIPLFKLGVGGNLGSGKQYQSWITLADEISAIQHLLSAGAVAGAVNLTAPSPVRNSELTKAIAATVHRPSLLPTPAFALRLALGQFSDEGVLVSQRVIPKALLDSDFAFQHSDLDAALKWATAN